MVEELKLWNEWGVLSKDGSFDCARKVDFYNLHSSFIRQFNLTDKPDVVCVIPAYNESNNVPKALASLNNSLRNVENLRVKTVVVDNKSSDATKDVSLACGAEVIQEGKIGLGNARQAGLEYSCQLGAKILMYSDADSVVPKSFIGGHSNALAKDGKVYSKGSLLFLPDNLHILNFNRMLRTLFYSMVANSAHTLLNSLGVWTAVGSGAYLIEEAKKVGGYVRSKLRGVDSTLMHAILNNTPRGFSYSANLCVLNSSRRLDAEGIIRHGLWRVRNDIRGIINGLPDTDNKYINYR